jgi:hypothetical protein
MALPEKPAGERLPRCGDRLRPEALHLDLYGQGGAAHQCDGGKQAGV